MKDAPWSLLFALGLASCGATPDIQGTGTVRTIDSIEYQGVALVDGGRLLEVKSDETNSAAYEEGSIVRYEATYDTDRATPAGVPQPVRYQKFEIIGIEN